MGINNSNLLVATLNFSDICLSPFEFYGNSVEQDILSFNFEQLMKTYEEQILEFGGEKKNNKFVWKFGKIDRKFQLKRYSPIYNKEMGIENQSLVDRKQFNAKWEAAFQAQNIQNELDIEKSKQMLKLFDWIAYETILRQIYNKKDFDNKELQNKQSKENKSKVSQKKEAKFKIYSVFNKQILNNLKLKEKFKQFIKKWHSADYLDNSKKIQKTKNFVEKNQIDVLFMQQSTVESQNLTEQLKAQQRRIQNIIQNQPNKKYSEWYAAFDLKKYIVVTREKSSNVIIIRRQKFEEQKQVIKQYSTKDPNFPQDTVFYNFEGYLLISAHFSSKKQTDALQEVSFFKFLKDIRQKEEDTQIIIGITSNCFLGPMNYSLFNIVPTLDTIPTTIKKRTALQAQSQKANQLVIETKDHLISTLDFKRHQVINIAGERAGKGEGQQYLPSNTHPFDHFIVWGQLVKNSKQN